MKPYTPWRPGFTPVTALVHAGGVYVGTVDSSVPLAPRFLQRREARHRSVFQHRIEQVPGGAVESDHDCFVHRAILVWRVFSKSCGAGTIARHGQTLKLLALVLCGATLLAACGGGGDDGGGDTSGAAESGGELSAQATEIQSCVADAGFEAEPNDTPELRRRGRIRQAHDPAPLGGLRQGVRTPTSTCSRTLPRCRTTGPRSR